MKPVTISISEVGIHEAGATVLAHLAFPAEAEADARRLYVAAACHALLRNRAEHFPSWANTFQAIKPAHAFVSPADFKRGFRTSERRLRDREIAGRMAIGLLAEAVTGQRPKLPAPMKRLSLNELAAYHAKLGGDQEPANLIKRAWSASRPVIHLAAAMEIYLRKAPSLGLQGHHADVMHLPAALQSVVDLATQHRALIPGIPKFGQSLDELLEIVLTD